MRQIGHGLEIKVGGHQDVVWGVHREFNGKGICVGELAIHAKLRRMYSSFGGRGNDEEISPHETLQD